MKNSRRRQRPTSRPLLEPLEQRELLSGNILVTSGPIARGVVLLYQRPQIVSSANPTLVQGSPYGSNTLLATITNALTGTVKTTTLYTTLNVAFGWDDGTVSVGTVVVHNSNGLPLLGANGQALQEFDLYISGGNHTVGDHAVYAAFWQWNGAAHPRLLTDFSFTTTVAITRNSANGQTINGQAGQTFSGSVGTLPADALPAGLSSPQSSPITVTSGPSSANLIHVTIAWGDGTSDEATLVKNSDGSWDVQGSHTYADAGTYRMSVVMTTQATVPPGYSGPPVMIPALFVSTTLALNTAIISPTPPAIQTTALQAFTSSLGSIHLPAGHTPANTTVMIAWGDGASTKATLVANTSGGYTVMGTHTYSQAGVFSIEITANPGDLPGVLHFLPGDNQIRLFQTATIAPPIAIPL